MPELNPPEPNVPGPNAAGSLPARFFAAAQYKTPLFSGAAVALALAAVALVVNNNLRSTTLLPIGLYALLCSVVLFVAGWVVGLRREVLEEAQAGERKAGVPNAAAAEPTDGADDAIDEDDNDDVEEASGKRKRKRKKRRKSKPVIDYAAKDELERFRRVGVPVVLVLGALSVLALAMMVLTSGVGVGGAVGERGAALSAATDPTSLFIAGGVALLLAFPLLVFSRALDGIDGARLPEARGLGYWLRGAQWFAILTGIALIVEGFRFEAIPIAPWIRAMLTAVAALAAVELVVRAFDGLFRRRTPYPDVEAPTDLILLSALFQGRNPIDGAMAVLEERLGVTLRTAWAIRFIRRAFFPLVLFVGFVLWLSTAFVVVGPGEEGVRLRFGKLASRGAVAPGLAFKLPWPFESIDRYATKRVRTLTLGYSGEQRDSLLWTQSHTGEEYKLLLGDGRELVSVDATVTYRIRDVVEYALENASPADRLDADANRLLMNKLVAADLSTVLSVDRDAFSAAFSADLQAIADRRKLGIEVVHTSFVSLHPPVKVAADYQKVVSEQIAARTRVIRAEGERATRLSMTLAEVYGEAKAAEADALVNVAAATAAVARFRSDTESYRAAPDLFLFREWIDSLSEGLLDRGLIVLDSRLDAETGGSIYLNAGGAAAAGSEAK